jgi:hypothetical protein
MRCDDRQRWRDEGLAAAAFEPPWPSGATGFTSESPEPSEPYDHSGHPSHSGTSKLCEQASTPGCLVSSRRCDRAGHPGRQVLSEPSDHAGHAGCLVASEPNEGGQLVAGGRPGSECAARNERSNERGRGAAGSPDPYPRMSTDLFLLASPIRTSLRARTSSASVHSVRRLSSSRGVAPERSAQRGTSGAATGGGGPQAPPIRMLVRPPMRIFF